MIYHLLWQSSSLFHLSFIEPTKVVEPERHAVGIVKYLGIVFHWTQSVSNRMVRGSCTVEYVGSWELGVDRWNAAYCLDTSTAFASYLTYIRYLGTATTAIVPRHPGSKVWSSPW